MHLVRHGEVDNPQRIVYGRLSGYPLTAAGHAMATASATSFATNGRPVARLISSPLERARQSAKPWAEIFDLPIEQNEALIEASSKLEGGQFDVSLSILARPEAWPLLVNPFRPSWGEPFAEVAARIVQELLAANDEPADGDVVMVSHQLPIWMAHRVAVGRPLFHDPRRRRCALSSITSFEVLDGKIIEVGYDESAWVRASGITDAGAV